MELLDIPQIRTIAIFAAFLVVVILAGLRIVEEKFFKREEKKDV